MVFTFVNNLVSVGQATVTGGTGSVSSTASGPNANQYTVNLTGVANAQYVTVGLVNAKDSTGAIGNVIGTMGVLVGDVTGNGVVSNTDVSNVKAQVAATVATANFRNDVNANGIISNTDVGATKAQVGTQLPSTP